MQEQITSAVKLRTLIKCILYWAVFTVMIFVFVLMFSSFLSKEIISYYYGLIATLAAVVCTVLVLKYEKQSFRSYGLTWEPGTFRRFFSGLGIGVLIFLGIILLLVCFSELEVIKNPTHWVPASLMIYLLIIPAAFMEELVFRSYAFIQLDRVFGLRITQWIVAIVFALYHVVQGWGIEIAFIGPGTWAFVFGLAAVWSKGIAVPTGIHVALNMMQHIMGFKGGAGDAIWVIQKNTTSLHTPIATSENIGIVSQILVLVVALFFTEYYIRKGRKKY